MEIVEYVRLLILTHLNFYFLEEGLRLVSPPHFEYEFLGEMFLMLYSIKQPSFISDYFYILRC